MKLISNQIAGRPASRRRRTAMTLVEVMLASAIMTMVILALVSANWIGMHLDQVVQSKGGASDTSRIVLNQFSTDIRGAKMWFIGNMSGTNFSTINNNLAQQGPALKLFTTTNNSQSYILYYFDTTWSSNNDGLLWRVNSTNLNNPVVMASNLIKTLNFTAEDYMGNVTTNQGSSTSYKNVIHAQLQFCQFQYPTTQVGTNGLYDFYILNYRATPHLPE